MYFRWKNAIKQSKMNGEIREDIDESIASSLMNNLRYSLYISFNNEGKSIMTLADTYYEISNFMYNLMTNK